MFKKVVSKLCDITFLVPRVWVKHFETTLILLTCGAVGILWACSEGAGSGPLFYSYPHPMDGHENKTFSKPNAPTVSQ